LAAVPPISGSRQSSAKRLSKYPSSIERRDCTRLSGECNHRVLVNSFFMPLHPHIPKRGWPSDSFAKLRHCSLRMCCPSSVAIPIALSVVCWTTAKGTRNQYPRPTAQSVIVTSAAARPKRGASLQRRLGRGRGCGVHELNDWRRGPNLDACSGVCSQNSPRLAQPWGSEPDEAG